jgi:hypothetical protein
MFEMGECICSELLAWFLTIRRFGLEPIVARAVAFAPLHLI